MRKYTERREEWLQLAKTHLDEQSFLRFVLITQDDTAVFLPLQGDFERFGLREGETLPLEALRGRIETDHLFVDILGEAPYLSFLAEKVFAIKDTEVFLVPWKQDGHPLWLLVRLKKACRKEGKDVLVGEIVHIHDGEPHTLTLFRLAHLDDPTGLGNRQALRKRLPRLAAEKTHHALYLDLDDFREINDTYGHITGDNVLKEVARRLQKERTKKREFYRVGGDEFLAVLPDTKEDEARRFAEKLTTMFSDIEIEDERIDLSASVGLVEITETDRDFVKIVEKADKAMYAAKEKGKAAVVVHC